MTYYQAAIEVLRTAQRPLSAREIADQALERGLIRTHGKTPEASIRAALYMQLNRDDPDLVKLADGVDKRGRDWPVRWTLRQANRA
jgi:hypothetical protein